MKTFQLPEDCSNGRILVIGDLMLDEYLWGHIERISPEAPVPILKVERREETLGGTGNVVKNLHALGVKVSIVGTIGEDDTGQRIAELLKGLGVETSGIVCEPQRKSTRKVRLMSIEHGQQVFRLDEESGHAIHHAVEDRIVDLIQEMAADNQLILCSDYLKGVLTPRVLHSAFTAGRESRVTTVVAPKDSDPRKYGGANILMPNLREFAQLVGSIPDGISWLTDSAARLMRTMCLEAMVVTRGKDGMTLFERMEGNLRCVHIPTAARSVYDVTGAGDSALAAFSAAIASGSERESAAHFANIAAGIVVGRSGTATVTLEEIRVLLRERDAPHSFMSTEAHA